MTHEGAPVRYRPGPRQTNWLFVLLPAAYLLTSARHSLALFAAYAAVIAFALVLQLVQGVDLWPDALVVRRPGRTTTVPWGEVWSVTMSARRTSIHVRSARGSWTLPAPTDYRWLGADRAFPEKAETVMRYWVAGRGRDWRPPEPIWTRAPGTAPAP
jgi:hypothetical protein